MDPKHNEIFLQLRQRIKTIISMYEEQKNKSEGLRNRNKELNEQVEFLENKLKTIDKKYENLKIAKVLSSVPDDDIHDTKLQVNRIVREIDKCIALLNR
jgi:hypothetical protein